MENIFDIASKVATPISLLAFIAAALLFAYRMRINSELELIKSATERDRKELIEASLETYHLKQDNLTRDQKYKLVVKVIEEKRKKLMIVIIALILLLTIALSAWLIEKVIEKSPTSIAQGGKSKCVESEIIELTLGEEGTEYQKFDSFIKLTQADELICTVIRNNQEYEISSGRNNFFESKNCRYVISRVSYNSRKSSCKIRIANKEG